MCGRFTLRASASEIAEFFELMRDLVQWDQPRFNIAPTQSILAVREVGTGREPVRLRWGLIPSWSKDTKMAASMINARAETVAEKPAFRAAFRRRRCLIPVSGFYEWQRDGKTKTPHLISPRNAALFGFAGLWEKWQAPDGELMDKPLVEANAISKQDYANAVAAQKQAQADVEIGRASCRERVLASV